MAGRGRRGNTACDEDHVRRPPLNNKGESRVTGNAKEMNRNSGLTGFVRRNPVFEGDDAEEVYQNVTPNRPNRHMRPQSRKFSDLQPARWIVGVETADNPYGQEMHQMQQQFQGIQGQGIPENHQGFQDTQENQVQPSHQQLQTIQGQQYLQWQQHQQQPWQQQQQLWQQGHQPHQLQYNDGSSPIYTVQPPTQTMTRGDPDKSSEPGVPELKDPASRCLLVFKRLLSIALVICDTVLDWMEYSDFLPENVSDAIDTAERIKSFLGKTSKAEITYNCDASENYYLVFTIFGTLFALIQIADTIGETLPDLTTKYKGFRLLHGFNEVLITFILEEIPQAICLVFFSFKCGCEFDLDINGKGLRKIYTTIFGLLSGYTRNSTCRQVERPSCYFELDFPSFCCFIPLCDDPSQDLKACTCNCYKLPPCDICPDSSSKISCLSIVGVNDRDRKFAKWMTAKLAKVYTVVSVVLIVSVVLRECL
ncbi:uncharacterized protein LOC110450377 [Mizuhopecten yessoensis]|uniref:uncharacterized protein LOC110450377 n=1 Tax=Mizuhopecten yessoensis TaxID=6573 RepID=UPI000B45B3D9|nr:uncharacterized protein LOC110450377 [Mizuhopecten yessoensis]